MGTVNREFQQRISATYDLASDLHTHLQAIPLSSFSPELYKGAAVIYRTRLQPLFSQFLSDKYGFLCGLAIGGSKVSDCIYRYYREVVFDNFRLGGRYDIEQRLLRCTVDCSLGDIACRDRNEQDLKDCSTGIRHGHTCKVKTPMERRLLPRLAKQMFGLTISPPAT